MLDIDRLIAFVHFVIRNKPFFVWGNLNKLKGNRTPIELIYLWMPNVKNTGIGTADYFYIGSNIFTIQHHVLISPSMWKSFLISLTLQRFLFIIKITQHSPHQTLELWENPIDIGKSFHSQNHAKSQCHVKSQVDLFPMAFPFLAGCTPRVDYKD